MGATESSKATRGSYKTPSHLQFSDQTLKVYPQGKWSRSVVRRVTVANVITELFCSTKQTLNVCTPQLRPTSAHYVSTPRTIDVQTTSLLPYLDWLRSTKVNISDHLQPQPPPQCPHPSKAASPLSPRTSPTHRRASRHSPTSRAARPRPRRSRMTRSPHSPPTPPTSSRSTPRRPQARNKCMRAQIQGLMRC